MPSLKGVNKRAIKDDMKTVDIWMWDWSTKVKMLSKIFQVSEIKKINACICAIIVAPYECIWGDTMV